MAAGPAEVEETVVSAPEKDPDSFDHMNKREVVKVAIDLWRDGNADCIDIEDWSSKEWDFFEQAAAEAHLPVGEFAGRVLRNVAIRRAGQHETRRDEGGEVSA